MLKLYDQALDLSNSSKKLKRRADAALEKVGTAEKKSEELRQENEKLKGELAKLVELKRKADEQLEEERAGRQKAIDAARAEGHSAGFDEAGQAYAGDIYALVKDGEHKGFGNGYLFACDAFGIPADDPRREVPDAPDSPVAEESLEDDAEGTPEGDDVEASEHEDVADKVSDPERSSEQVILPENEPENVTQ
jgi:hypothetical protein